MKKIFLIIVLFIICDACSPEMDVGPGPPYIPFSATFGYLYPNPIHNGDTLTIGIYIVKNDTIEFPKSINNISFVYYENKGNLTRDTFEITYYYNPETKVNFGNLKNDSIIPLMLKDPECYIFQTKINGVNNRIGSFNIEVFHEYDICSTHLIIY